MNSLGISRRRNPGLPPGDRSAATVIITLPPFGGAQDIAHILHARTFLAPGGQLVALCANGPRQIETLRPIVLGCSGIWEDLPHGTFAAQGTGVHVALIVLPAAT